MKSEWHEDAIVIMMLCLVVVARCAVGEFGNVMTIERLRTAVHTVSGHEKPFGSFFLPPECALFVVRHVAAYVHQCDHPFQ